MKDCNRHWDRKNENDVIGKIDESNNDNKSEAGALSESRSEQCSVSKKLSNDPPKLVKISTSQKLNSNLAKKFQFGKPIAK